MAQLVHDLVLLRVLRCDHQYVYALWTLLHVALVMRYNMDRYTCGVW